MPQFDRTSGHRSQPKSVVHKGELSPEQLIEGVPSFSQTDNGVVQYIKINGVVYKNHLYRSEGADAPFDFGDNGHVELPGGLIVQWGLVGVPGHSADLVDGYLSVSARVSFPIAFRSKLLSIVGMYITQATDDQGIGHNSLGVRTTSNSHADFTTSTYGDAFYWIAIGF